MDERSFDAVVRGLTRAGSRRSAVVRLLGGGLGFLGLSTAEAKHKKKHKNKRVDPHPTRPQRECSVQLAVRYVRSASTGSRAPSSPISPLVGTARASGVRTVPASAQRTMPPARGPGGASTGRAILGRRALDSTLTAARAREPHRVVAAVVCRTSIFSRARRAAGLVPRARLMATAPRVSAWATAVNRSPPVSTRDVAVGRAHARPSPRIPRQRIGPSLWRHRRNLRPLRQ